MKHGAPRDGGDQAVLAESQVDILGARIEWSADNLTAPLNDRTPTEKRHVLGMCCPDKVEMSCTANSVEDNHGLYHAYNQ